MSGMSITEMRKLRINFSDSYLLTGQMALMRSEDIDNYRSAYAIMNSACRVGVEKGTTGDLLVRRNFTKARSRVYRSKEQAVKALLRKKIDVFIHDAPVIITMAAENESRGLVFINQYFTEEHLAWGIRKDDVQLLALVNGVLKNWKDSKELDEKIFEWIPYFKVFTKQGYKLY